MRIEKNVPHIVKNFSTNGVLRCVSGHLPTGNTEKSISDTADILGVVKDVFNYSDNEVYNLLQSNNPFSVFICTIGAGKKLLANNSVLEKLLNRLKIAEANNRVDEELSKIISEVGENIDLNV